MIPALLRNRTLPLGIEIAAERVAVVAAQAADGTLRVTGAACEAVSETTDDKLDELLTETLRDVVRRIQPATRQCVLSAPWSETVARRFRIPPGMQRREAERAAELEADVVAPWPSSERLIALDPIPGRRRELMLTIGRAATLERLVSIARAARLEPLAIDTPACAWRRVAPHADAVLDAGGVRAALVTFADAVPSVNVFAPRLIDERLAAGVRLALIEARRDEHLDLKTLVVFAPPERYDALAPSFSDEGYAVEPVRLGDAEAPTWALAYGLASWALRRSSAA